MIYFCMHIFLCYFSIFLFLIFPCKLIIMSSFVLPVFFCLPVVHLYSDYSILYINLRFGSYTFLPHNRVSSINHVYNNDYLVSKYLNYVMCISEKL